MILGALIASRGGAPGEARGGFARAVVERYRTAPNGREGGPRRDAGWGWSLLRCGGCAAKVACLASSRPTVRGMALKHEVEVALDDLDAGKLTREQALGLGLPAKLDEASRAIEEGRGEARGV